MYLFGRIFCLRVNEIRIRLLQGVFIIVIVDGCVMGEWMALFFTWSRGGYWGFLIGFYLGER